MATHDPEGPPGEVGSPLGERIDCCNVWGDRILDDPPEEVVK